MQLRLTKLLIYIEFVFTRETSTAYPITVDPSLIRIDRCRDIKIQLGSEIQGTQTKETEGPYLVISFQVCVLGLTIKLNFNIESGQLN